MAQVPYASRLPGDGAGQDYLAGILLQFVRGITTKYEANNIPEEVFANQPSDRVPGLPGVAL